MGKFPATSSCKSSTLSNTRTHCVEGPYVVALSTTSTHRVALPFMAYVYLSDKVRGVPESVTKKLPFKIWSDMHCHSQTSNGEARPQKRRNPIATETVMGKMHSTSNGCQAWSSFLKHRPNPSLPLKNWPLWIIDCYNELGNRTNNNHLNALRQLLPCLPPSHTHKVKVLVYPWWQRIHPKRGVLIFGKTVRTTEELSVIRGPRNEKGTQKRIVTSDSHIQ